MTNYSLPQVTDFDFRKHGYEGPKVPTFDEYKAGEYTAPEVPTFDGYKQSVFEYQPKKDESVNGFYIGAPKYCKYT